MAISLSLQGMRRRTRVYDISELESVIGYLERHLVPIGAVVQKLSDVSPGDGWLPADGRWLAKDDYRALYDDIGGTFGEDGDTFRLPDLRGAYLVGSNGEPVGSMVGQNSTALSIGNLPAHAHTVIDPGHAHSFTPTPHAHALTDPQHSHSAAAVGSAVQVQSGTGTSITPAVAGNTGPASTGISVNNASAGGAVETASAGVSLGETGDGEAFDNRPRSLVVYPFIKVSQ